MIVKNEKKVKSSSRLICACENLASPQCIGQMCRACCYKATLAIPCEVHLPSKSIPSPPVEAALPARPAMPEMLVTTDAATETV